jgi:hypothetical protein
MKTNCNPLYNFINIVDGQQNLFSIVCQTDPNFNTGVRPM